MADLRGIGPFATFLIVGPTCFFLGIMFAYLPYDYYVLWATPPYTTLETDPRAPFFDIHENHLKFIHGSAPLISRMLHLVIAVGLLGFVIKLYKPSDANKLFDGASLALYMAAITVYGVNLVKGMRAATAGHYGDKSLAEDDSLFDKSMTEDAAQYLGREDSLRVVAASDTILAFILIGILMLQAGQWYALRQDAAELEKFEKAKEEKQKSKTGAVSKKKQ